MEPSIRVGDVVVVERGAQFGVGDVVMWCSSPFYCVVHRVIEVGPYYVVTRGDANPAPDLPVARSSVIGKVAAVIPREVFLVIILSSVAVLVWVKRRSIFAVRDPLSFMAYGLIAFLTLSVAAILFFPVPSVFESREYRIPSVSMISALYRNGSVIMKYRMVGTSVDEVLSCGAGAPGVMQVRCVDAVAEDSLVVAYLPPSLLSELNERGISKFWVAVIYSLAKNGTLKGNYTVIFDASELLVNVVNGSLIVRNPNPFPIHYNLTVMYSTDGLRWFSNVSAGALSGFDNLVIDAGGWGKVWYRLTYTLMGKAVEVAGWVRGG